MGTKMSRTFWNAFEVAESFEMREPDVRPARLPAPRPLVVPLLGNSPLDLFDLVVDDLAEHLAHVVVRGHVGHVAKGLFNARYVVYCAEERIPELKCFRIHSERPLRLQDTLKEKKGYVSKDIALKHLAS